MHVSHAYCVPLVQLQYQAMGLVDSFEEDIASPSNSLPRVDIEELFDDPKYVSNKTIQVRPSQQCW